MFEYKKLRNYVKLLNDKAKKQYYQNLDPKKIDMSKTFWKTFKPFFSDNSEVNEKIILVEKEAVPSDDLQIAECMNNYFVNITKSLNIKEWPDPVPNLLCDDIVQKAIHKYSHHPSIIAIKSRFGDSNEKFNFQHILPIEVHKTVNELDATKSTRGDITTKIIKETIGSCKNKITDCFKLLFWMEIILQNLIRKHIFLLNIGLH